MYCYQFRARFIRQILFSVMGCLIACLSTPSTSSAQTVIFVDDDAPLGGDGQSWAEAYAILDTALDFASVSANGITEIRVAQGVYRPDQTEAFPQG